MTIEAQLLRLQDIENIKELRYRYAYGANIIDGQSGDLKAFAALFADDGIFDVGMGVATGPAEIEAMMKGLTTQWKCAMHYMLNPVIELDGDRASGKVSGLFAFVSAENPAPIWLSNIYSDTYVRTSQGWRFQSVHIQTTFADPAFFAGYADKLQS
ncbi:nuclear transport factor 2 family protein [Aquisediminimonas sediminicola]|uniref:nuclear transport factor 2 family protein n=1 Tax=Alteraquisediminimonas sediminicola TaxID=2676787 RepID=UPI001C8EEC87|nr:nuclear transport factor 2 family protein [Aquisediminimonas sediminicola]